MIYLYPWVEMRSSPVVVVYNRQSHVFLIHTLGILSELSSSWPDDSMAWVNFHVSSYYYSCGGLSHPRQLASCSLRSNSNESHRWSCWACQLEPEAAQAAGFSPSKSIWRTDIDQCYHWWQVHAKQSHWDWLRQLRSTALHCQSSAAGCWGVISPSGLSPGGRKR